MNTTAETQLATVQPVDRAMVPAAPSIETILMHAIETKVDPANLERLVALQERVMAHRAEQAFNAAMLAFREQCPAILKTGVATKPNGQNSPTVLYRFVTLEELTKTVDPVLRKNGLTYSWDTDVLNDLTVVTCTVRHVEGHKQSSKFTCKGSGTSIMNAAQIAASATTFGRRYSLLCVLGITADLDDDGRRAVPGLPPAGDPDAPTAPTRQERHENPDGSPRVSAETLNDLASAYCEKFDVDRTKARTEFTAWAKKVLRSEKPMTSPSHWTIDCVEVCRQALEEG